MIDDLDLFLHHRHPPGEVIVLPHLGGETFQLGVRDRLGGADALLRMAGGAAVGDQNPQQRKPSGDEGHRHRFRHGFPSFPSGFLTPGAENASGCRQTCNR